MFRFSVDVDEKKATSFLKARNSKMMCKKDTIIVAVGKEAAGSFLNAPFSTKLLGLCRMLLRVTISTRQ
eukprot:COSAG02_NODE_4722_length_5052_cov_9.256612_4_plen_69_part_00